MKWTKQRLNNLFFVIGVVAVVVMLFTFDISFVELWQHITHAGYWLVPIIGIWIVIYAINAWAWLCIIRGNCGAETPHGSRFLWRIYRLTITGYALNYATPVGGLGGEPYRILELSKDIGTQRATSSVILYAMMHFLAHFLLWFSTIFLYLALAAIGDLPLTPAIGVAFAAIIRHMSGGLPGPGQRLSGRRGCENLQLAGQGAGPEGLGHPFPGHPCRAIAARRRADCRPL